MLLSGSTSRTFLIAIPGRQSNLTPDHSWSARRSFAAESVKPLLWAFFAERWPTRGIPHRAAKESSVRGWHWD